MRFFTVTLGCALALALAACGMGDSLVAPAAEFREFGVQAPDATPLLALTKLVIPTYEGSGQAVHPDVLWFPTGWHGYEYWMAFTPYPSGKEEFENPSIVASHDGIAWEVPSGLTNPVVHRTSRGAYNSDPDLSYDAAADQLVMLTREVRSGFNRVALLLSKDGVTWTGFRRTFLRRNHGMISPAMVLSTSRDPRLWYVDAGSKSCPKRVTRVLRQEGIGHRPLENPGVERGWGPPRASGLSQPGYQIWHLDVTWISARAEYWAVYPAYPSHTCGARDLFLATSKDGVRWTTYPVPLLRHEDARWTTAMLYRASALYDPARDAMRLYLSASAPGPDWRMGVVEFRMSDLLPRLAGQGQTAPGIARGTGRGRDTEPDALP